MQFPYTRPVESIKGESFRVIAYKTFPTTRKETKTATFLIPSGMYQNAKDLFKEFKFISLRLSADSRVGLYVPRYTVVTFVEKLKDLLGFSQQTFDHGDYKSEYVLELRAGITEVYVYFEKINAIPSNEATETESIKGESFRVIAYKTFPTNRKETKTATFLIPSGMYQNAKDLFKEFKFISLRLSADLEVGLHVPRYTVVTFGEKLKDLLGFSQQTFDNADYKSEYVLELRAGITEVYVYFEKINAIPSNEATETESDRRLFRSLTPEKIWSDVTAQRASSSYSVSRKFN
ncbi:hypothetical protein AVEN_235688-1 [Araneus ventricosus]|uniref:Uncharacterized protein n=1 Tax=Araneus ventricosus TaxID=182803 RepID=A0A4Y2RF30_ARAVE|nr:hypothetical protein AVEN_235688-1 [Araneus ventricosus]